MIFVSAAAAAATAVVVNAAITVVANRKKSVPQIDSIQFRIIFAQQYSLERSKKEMQKMETSSVLCLSICESFLHYYYFFSTAFIRVYHFTFMHLPTLNARRLSIQCHIIFKVQSNMEFFLHLIDESLSME